MHRLDRIDAAAARSVAIGSGFEVRLEDRLQHQFRGGLHHAVPDRRDAEWSLAAAGLRDHHPSHRLGLIRLGSQFRLDAGQPVLQPRRLDRREAHAINAWCALVGAHQVIRMAQNVRAVDLVVEQVEPEVRLRLRLEIELPLKRPDLIRCCQAHRQSPILGSFESAPEVRVLPSAGVTQPQQYRRPCPTPAEDHRPMTMLKTRPPSHAGLPQLPGSPFRHAVPTTPMDQNGCVCRLLPRPTRAFPVIQAGRRP